MEKRKLGVLGVFVASLLLCGCEASPVDNTATNWTYVQTSANGYCVAIDLSPLVGECLTGLIKDPGEAAQVSKELNEALSKARSHEEKRNAKN